MCRWWQVGWLCLLSYLLLAISVASSTVASSLVLKDQQPTPSVTLVAGYSDHSAQPFMSEQRISSPQQLSSISADSPTAIHFTSSRLIIFIYAGMIILGLYQLFMFLVLREANYLLLAVYIFSATLALHRVSPIFPELLFLSDAGYYFYSAPFFLMLAVHAEFTRRVLDLKDYAPKLNKIYKGSVMFALALVLLSGLMPKESMFPIIFTFGLLFLSIISSRYIARRGHRIAYYFAWIYWLPVIIHLPGMLFLLVETERFDQSLATLTSIGTLIFML
ncbi:MAG TPA: 7TM-DISM domain-containing protein, partial [Thiolinea sp.]|nr:7TM-DISM domain-containing protein [Thiolinea sp.]